MKLQTKVEINESDFQINYAKKGLVIGSCFADNFGKRLTEMWFDVLANPFGVLYNPVSVVRAVENISSCKKYCKSDLVEYDGLWHSFEHHGEFSSANPNEVLDAVNRELPNEFDYIIITLGTAWVYKYKGAVVSNCHKIPAKEFDRERLGVEESFLQLQKIVNCYPNTKIIFTVSPIRHIKDGLDENFLSKSILRCAIAMICERHCNCSYFPSYEIVNDELRDYRFYKEDMVHPTSQAIEYVLERFEESYFDKSTQIYSDKIKKIRLALNHKPLHIDSQSYEKFVATTKTQIEFLKKEYNHLIDNEIFTNFGT